ncbi:MAG: hypothetical protein CSYNP_03748 [Syntrophus sp. SKADARSKE-3]|nr:hypothetical protein [Syntrophus sp. SKADARSKE-3]
MKLDKIGKKEIQIIHIAKSQLMMNDEEYRKLLKSFGVSTSKDLSTSQYGALLLKFQAEGFILTSKKKEPYGNYMNLPWDKKPLMKKIEALLATMKLSGMYADGIAKHMFKIDSVSWCTPVQLHKIVAALEYKKRKVIDCKQQIN